MRIRDPGWRQFGSEIRDGKKSDPGSGINIPDPPHCQPVHKKASRPKKVNKIRSQKVLKKDKTVQKTTSAPNQSGQYQVKNISLYNANPDPGK